MKNRNITILLAALFLLLLTVTILFALYLFDVVSFDGRSSASERGGAITENQNRDGTQRTSDHEDSERSGDRDREDSENTQPKIEVKAEYLACETDEQCTVTSSTCCGCEAGGDQTIGINKDFVEEFRAEQLKCVEGEFGCVTRYQCENVGVRCVNNLCQAGGTDTEGGEARREGEDGDRDGEGGDGERADREDDESSKRGSERKLRSDTDGSGKVELRDYALFVDDYKKCKMENECPPRSDINGDGEITIADYSLYLESYLTERSTTK